MTRRATVAAVTLASLFIVAQAAEAKRAHWQVEALEQLLTTSKDPLRRESAALALGRRGSPGALPLLSKALVKDKDRWVRARCAEALGRIGDLQATKALLSALTREKHQRVRREVAEALVRLGRREGLLELMWQLRSGTNHSKAAAMKALVDLTGMPLGQQVKDWWSYLAAGGYNQLARRPTGSPGIHELAGTPRVHYPAGKPAPWRMLPTVVIRLKPSRAPVTAQALRAYEGWHGPIADGCLLLIETGWSTAAARKPARKRGKPARGAGPGLTLAAAKHLLARAPKLLGVGIDTPTLEPPAVGGGHPVRDLLVGGGALALENVAELGRLSATGTRLLLLNAADRPHLLAILP